MVINSVAQLVRNRKTHCDSGLGQRNKWSSQIRLYLDSQFDQLLLRLATRNDFTSLKEEVTLLETEKIRDQSLLKEHID